MDILRACGMAHYSSLSKEEKNLSHKYNPIKFIKEKHKRQKKDFRMIIAGDNGNGKSSLACREGENENPNTFIKQPQWAVNNQIHMFAKDWLKATGILPMYGVNMYDEPAQSGGHHREFMSEANIIITKTVATVRFKRFNIPINIPFIDMLDVDLRKLCQVYVHCYDQGKAEAFLIHNPKFGGKPYYETIVDDLTWDMPNEKLWKLYEKKKFKTEGNEYKKYEEQLHKKDQQQKTDGELIEEMHKNKDSLYNDKDKMTIINVQASVNVGKDRAGKLRHLYLKKYEEGQI